MISTPQPATGPARPERIGQFQVLDTLGQGSQGVVYLAREPNLGRRVVIKTLHPRKVDPRDLTEKAKAVGRLQHLHIVPVVEVGEHEGSPYIVHEYASGRSLKKLLREDGPLPVQKAVSWMLQILDAVGHAHDQGIVHRYLNTANIQVGDDNVPRIMDFGIATVAGDPQPGDSVWGTVNYLAPELLNGEPAEPASDIFSLGLILHEMVTGTPAISTNDPMATLYWIAQRKITPPSTHRPELKGEFEQIVQRALQKEPEDRYPTVWHMQEPLRCFLDDSPPHATDMGDGSALSYVLRRIRRRADFPAIGETIALILEKTATNSDASVDELANVILKDYALTTKLLRVVNSSFYGQYGGHISTVSRAVVVLGLTQIRNAALSLLLFDQLENKPQAYELKETAGRAFLAGNIGRRIASALRIPEPERAFVCSMFYTLGQYLTILYLPEEHAQILDAVVSKGMDEDTASRTILGLTPQELAIGVARDWKLPKEIVQSLRKPPDEIPPSLSDPAELLRYVAAFANELTDVVIRPPGNHKKKDLRLLRKRFQAHVGIPESELSDTVASALEDLAAYADAFDLNLRISRFYRNASNWVTGESSDTPAEGTTSEVNSDAGTDTPSEDAPGPEAIVLSGIQDITQALLCNYALNDILVMVLETIFRGMGFDRVLLCIRDVKHSRMSARFGLGDNVDALAERFHFPLTPGDDLFSRAINEQEDLVCNTPETSNEVPAWHKKLVSPAAFVLCPIVVNGLALGLIYADREEANRPITQTDLNHLNSIRNQAALAIKQNT